jgi:hypothetical protein
MSAGFIARRRAGARCDSEFVFDELFAFKIQAAKV